MIPEDEERSLRQQCTHSLGGHGIETAGQMLASIPAAVDIDRYGDGGVVAQLETDVAGLLGKQKAVFLPSGTMAQQIVLRIHADRRSRRTVLYHPMCHLHHHEGQALERLQGLIGRPVGEASRLLSLDDLTGVAEPAAVLLLELPQRDIGGQQPGWDDLQGQIAWARERGAAVHLDGARLWESSAGYERPPAEIAAGFDSVYVSFYKGIGALAGCCVAGEEDLVAEVREWRRRMGGTLFGLWPNAASALTLLRQRLPKMPQYRAHALAIADALRSVAGVSVLPDPPQTTMMHLLLRASAESIEANIRRLAKEQELWTFRSTMSTGDAAVQRVELSVGDATCELSAAEIAAAVAELLRD